MTPRSLFAASAFCLLLATPAAVRADDAAEIAAIRKKAGEIANFRASMAMTMSMMGQRQEMTGTVQKQGQKLRMETDMPAMGMKQIVVSDGKVVHTHIPMMNMVQTMDVERIRKAGADDMAAAMTQEQNDPFGATKTEDLTLVGREKLDDADVVVVEGPIPQAPGVAPGMLPAKVRAWFDAKDGMVRQSVFFAQDGSEMITQKVTDYEINPTFEEGTFEFQVPADAQVVDMTDSIIKMAETLRQGQD